MPHDPHLADLMRSAIAGRPGVSERRMFGGICWMLNGNMLCGVETGRFMFRVGPELHAEALSRPGAGPMEFTGRPMKGFVWVDADASIEAGLDNWIYFASRFVGALAPK
jgi:TfoX/Sxy family transcriptional regulator of competence genes